MQNTSQAYKDSMVSPLRERGYIQVEIGGSNSEAEKREFIDTDEMSPYGMIASITSLNRNNPLYATLEGHIFKVDGSMIFTPPNISYSIYQGVISKIPVTSSKPFNIYISFNQSVTFKGFTLNFRENYPKHFKIISNGSTIDVDNNKLEIWATNYTFENVTQIQIQVLEMPYYGQRFRLYGIRFGVDYLYTNEDILQSDTNIYVSPTSENIFQADTVTKLRNDNHEFDWDNPQSIINMLEDGLDITIKYGYQLPESNTIEWIKGGTYKLSEVDATNEALTLKSTDVIRTLDTQYNDGSYEPYGEPYSTKISELLGGEGISFEYDSVLQSISTHNPIPRVTKREALQLIANACCCTMYQDKDGMIQIRQIVFNDFPVTSGFHITKNDMITNPVITKRESVKSINIHWYQYEKNATSIDILVDKTMDLIAGQEYKIYLEESCYNQEILIDEQSSGATGVGMSDLIFIFTATVSGTHNVKIKGYKYSIYDNIETIEVNNSGKIIDWKNPLIDSKERALAVGEWLKSYYLLPFEYQFEYRGNPEIDILDNIYEQAEFKENMQVKVIESIFTFNQTFSGSLKTLRGAE